ncbi:TIGR03986 family type III CRISPR-associated RAMP protein [Shouchella lehensis]|nr:TIGR03986 family CRISPR-associated RAMP protein [Shouchella lehensis]
MTDKKKNLVVAGDRFVNPYNFVSLAEKCKRRKPEKGEFTGYFECTLTNLSPLFIPNSETISEDEVQEFFSYNYRKGETNYKPTIPGSELKGMVRSVHEAAFNGCLSQINLDKPIHKRSMEPKKPGLLSMDKKTGQFFIQPCERVMLNVTKGNPHGELVKKGEYVEGEVVYIKRSIDRYKKDINGFEYPYVVDKVSKKFEEGFTKGYIHIGEHFVRKHHESVFVPNNEDRTPIKKEEIDKLEKVIANYGENDINKNLKTEGGKHFGYSKYKSLFYRFLNKTYANRFLVFYSEENHHKNKPIFVNLAPAMLSQEASLKTINELIKEHGEYQPCVCKDLLCPSCALFGFASNKEAKASKVRFGDAETVNKQNYFKEPIAILLGEPKFNTTEFYTVLDEKLDSSKVWTYDYIVKANKKRVTFNPDEIKIRGRKFYWHGSKVPANLQEKSKMIQKIRPLKENQSFVFRVYFEQLTKRELQQLQWSLDFNNKNNAHKLGRGKPLGYGSVQVKLEKLALRQFDFESGEWKLSTYKPAEIVYWKSEEKNRDLLNNKLSDKANSVRKQLLEITSINLELKDLISYPKIKGTKNDNRINAKASHQWFTKNRKLVEKNKKKNLPTISQELDNKQENKHLKKL